MNGPLMAPREYVHVGKARIAEYEAMGYTLLGRVGMGEDYEAVMMVREAPRRALQGPSDDSGRPAAEAAQDASQVATSAFSSQSVLQQSALVTFFVPGKPAKKGSHNSRAFVGAAGQLGSYTYDADKGLPKWAKAVKLAATIAMREAHGTGVTPTIKPVAVRVVFLFARPKSHGLRWGTRGKPRQLPPPTSLQLGDVDKLCRALFDPMTGVVWGDDAQVVRLEAEKQYCEPSEVPGARVVVLEVQT